MGDVIALHRPKCTCGWKYPHHVRVEGIIPNPFSRVVVRFECPECGHKIEYGGIGGDQPPENKP